MSSLSSDQHDPTAGPDAAISENGDDARPEALPSDIPAEERSRDRLAERASTLALADLLALVDTALHIAVRTTDSEHQLAVYTEEIQEQLTRWHSRHVALSVEVDRLRRKLLDSDAVAAKERQFLIDQQDQFLGSLLDDHERGVEALRADCARAWRKVSELQAELRSGTATLGASEPALVSQHDIPREVLLRAKQQRDEAQRQTVEALSRLDSAMAELEQLRALVAPSTLPPSPELPISMPPEGALRAAPVPDLRTPPSQQPHGWRRSVPPIKRESASFGGVLGAAPPQDPGAERPEGEAYEDPDASANWSEGEPTAPGRRLARSDLPAIAGAEADALREAPHDPPPQRESRDSDPATSSGRPDSLRGTRGGYSITLDGPSPLPGRHRNVE